MAKDKYTCPHCNFKGNLPAYFCECCGRRLGSVVAVVTEKSGIVN